jgi:hypothetical protein
MAGGPETEKATRATRAERKVEGWTRLRAGTTPTAPERTYGFAATLGEGTWKAAVGIEPLDPYLRASSRSPIETGVATRYIGVSIGGEANRPVPQLV